MTPAVRTSMGQGELPFDAAGCASATPDLSVAMKRFPRTRYQGSKRRWAPAIVNELGNLTFQRVLDAFGGTGSVAYAFKVLGESVTYNDVLGFNHQIGLALIENDAEQLPPDWAHRMGAAAPGVRYDDFIARTFKGIYFTDEENAFLDRAAANIPLIENRYARATAWFALFQAAMAKRPYNLFHRKNLYMRQASVRRGFGNKATWDRSFTEHVARYIAEANRAIIDGRGSCRAVQSDVFEIAPAYDLVYLDPPYVNARGVGVDYRDFYHFLEGMIRYQDWPDLLDRSSRNLRLLRAQSPWRDAARIRILFRDLLHHFRTSILAVSYRSDGIPDVSDIAKMMRDFKRRVRIVDSWSCQYALSKNRRSRQVLLIGTD